MKILYNLINLIRILCEICIGIYRKLLFVEKTMSQIDIKKNHILK